MTTATATIRSRERSGLSFGGILVSEWIKLRSLRSTGWCYLIMIVMTVGIGLLLSPVVGDIRDSTGGSSQSSAVLVATAGIAFSQLVVSVLGALVITGEYGTGMIRSTLTAVPRRFPALLAKAIVFGLVTFLVGLVAIVGTALITAPLLSGTGAAPDFGDGTYLLALLGGAGYLALVGVLSFSLGAIIRSSAGGIAAALGLILVVPTVVQIFTFTMKQAWVANLGTFLPSAAGAKMYEYAVTSPSAVPALDGVVVLDQLQGTLVLLAWVLVLFGVAAALLKSRDA